MHKRIVFYSLRKCCVLRRLYIPVFYDFLSNPFYILPLHKNRRLRPVEMGLWGRLIKLWDALLFHNCELNILVYLQAIEIINKMHRNSHRLDQDTEYNNHIYRDMNKGSFLSPTNRIQQFSYRYNHKWGDCKTIAWSP